ncbi:hypothetical protein RB213_012332 [Colletotrichum asianum]
MSFDMENAELVDEAFVHVRDGRRVGSGTSDRRGCRKEVENALKTAWAIGSRCWVERSAD